jgi:nucleolar protein 14
MRLLDQSARSIKLIEPVFNENYRFDKDGHDPDRQRAEVKKLKKLANRERKGVARELRKDAQFIAEVRGKEKQDKYDELRAQRIRNFNMLGNLQGETDKAVRDGGARGAGSSSANLKGKRR